MNRTSLSVERRRFLSGVTSAATGLIAVGISRAQTDVGAHLAVAYEEAGQPIASDFIGLSYESAILAAGDYFVPSYPMGVLADKVSRKNLLGLGLALNGFGFVALAFAPNYAWCLVAVALAGFGGSFYHPAATAMTHGLTLVTRNDREIAGLGAAVLNPFQIGENRRPSKLRQLSQRLR